jgi:hypothetical protein
LDQDLTDDKKRRDKTHWLGFQRCFLARCGPEIDGDGVLGLLGGDEVLDGVQNTSANYSG